MITNVIKLFSYTLEYTTKSSQLLYTSEEDLFLVSGNFDTLLEAIFFKMLTCNFFIFYSPLFLKIFIRFFITFFK